LTASYSDTKMHFSCSTSTGNPPRKSTTIYGDFFITLLRSPHVCFIISYPTYQFNDFLITVEYFLHCSRIRKFSYLPMDSKRPRMVARIVLSSYDIWYIGISMVLSFSIQCNIQSKPRRGVYANTSNFVVDCKFCLDGRF